MRKLLIILAVTLMATPAFAITGLSIGVRGGWVNNYDQAGLSLGDYKADQMNLFGAQIRFSSLPMVNLILFGDYAWKKNEYDFGGQTFEFKMQDFSFGASLVYPIKLKVVSPYFGGGISSHNLSYDYVKPLSLSLDDEGINIPGSMTRLGYHLSGGVNITLPAFPIGFSAEYRWNWIDTPGEVTDYTSLILGLNYNLP